MKAMVSCARIALELYDEVIVPEKMFPTSNQ
jgi:hypothetical protein